MRIARCGNPLFFHPIILVRTTGDTRNEEDVSTAHQEAEEHARIPRAHEDKERPAGPGQPPCQGSLETHPQRRALRTTDGCKRRLKSIERLRGPGVFEAVRTGGSVFDGRFLRFLYEVQGGHAAPIRLGIVMARRHGPAVIRNRIKRRIRAAWHEEAGSRTGLSQRLALSVVVVFKGSREQSSSRISYEEIRKDITRFVHVIQSSAAGTHGARTDLPGP